MENIDITNLTPEQLNSLLSTITSSTPDNALIKKATEYLKKYSENIQSVEGLLLQIKQNPEAKCRQLATVILYKSIDKHWNKIEESKQVLIKKLIIELYSQEKTYLVLKGIATIIFKICRQTLTNNQTDDLIGLVFSSPEKYSKEQAELFELNLYVIAELVSSNMEYLKGRLPEIKNILNTALNMGSNKMKENATRCLGSLISTLEKEQLNEFKQFNAIVFKEMKNFSEKTILKCYETLCDFNINSLYFFEGTFDQIVPLTIELLLNEEYNGNTKLVLSEFLIMTANYNKKIYTKNSSQFLLPFIQAAFKLLVSEDVENEEDIYNETSLFTIGSNMIRSITGLITSKKTFPILIEIIKKYSSSASAKERRGCIAIIGEMCEGCCTPMKDNIEDIIELLTKTFYNDADDTVKGQCIMAMDSVSRFCAPEVNEYYDKIIPMLIKGLYSPSEKIVEKSLFEIEYFCSNIDFEMEDYLDMNNEMNAELMKKLLNILETSKSMWIIEKCLDALSSVVTNAHNLQPATLLPIIETLKQITINKNTENDQKLIGSTLNCVANIASVVKYEKFSGYEDYFSKFAFNCITSKVYDLQFGGLSYFTSLADIKGNGFKNVFEEVMKNTLAIVNDKSGLIEKAKNADEFAMDSDSEDEMEGNEDLMWTEEFIEAKCSGIKAIGSYAKAVPELFVTHMPEVMATLEEMSNYVSDSVVFEVVGAYEKVLIGLGEAIKKLGADKCPDIDKIWCNDIFPCYEQMIENTDDQELVSECVCAIYGLINHFGKDIFNSKTNTTILNRIIVIIKKLLNNEMACQVKNEDIDEEDIDYEEDIIDSVKNLCLILGEKLGDDFHPYFTEVFPLLKNYLKVSHPEENRSMAFGILADVLKYDKLSTKFFIKDIYDAIDSNMAGKKKVKKNENLVRHIAYLIGNLHVSDPESAKPYLQKSLGYLQQIFELTKREAKDNVIASLCRIICVMKFNKSNFELFDKSVETILSNVPFKYDPVENLTVVDFLIYICELIGIEVYEKFIGNIMNVLLIVVVNDAKCQSKKEDFLKVKNYLGTLEKNEKIKGLIEGVMAKFTPNEKEKFVKQITSA